MILEQMYSSMSLQRYSIMWNQKQDISNRDNYQVTKTPYPFKKQIRSFELYI